MTQYHATLNGQGYVLALDRYAKRIREAFAPKQAASATALAVGDLRGPEQLLVIADWSGGEGYVQHDEAHPGRFRTSSGVDGYTKPGTLRLGPYAVAVGTTSSDVVRWLVTYGSKLYALCFGGLVYSYDGSTFTLEHTVTGTPNLLCGEVYMGVLYVGNAANDDVACFDAALPAWDDAVFEAGGVVRTMKTHYRQAAQYLYLGVTGAGVNGIGRIKYWDGSTISSGEFDTEEPIPGATFVLGQELYIIANDLGRDEWGLYSVDKSTSGGIWTRHAGRGVGFAFHPTVLGERAYVGFGGSAGAALYEIVDGDRVLAVAGRADLGLSATSQMLPVAWRGAVWLGVDESGPATAVLRYAPALNPGERGVLFRPVVGLAGAGGRSAAVWKDALYVGTQETGAAKLYRIDPLRYGASGTLETGLITFGLPGVTKLLRSVTIVCAPIESPQTIAVEYQLEDGGPWTTLGTLGTAGATTATYAFAAGVVCFQLALRVTLTGTAGASSSPMVYQVQVRYTPRPQVTREWELGVLLEGTEALPLVTLDGEAETLTGAELTAALWEAAAEEGPVTLVDLDGASYSVYVDDVREEVAQVSQRHGYQRLGIVRLVEAA